MITTRKPDISLTHSSQDKLTKEEISLELEQIKNRLTTQFKDDPQQLASLLQATEELSNVESQC